MNRDAYVEQLKALLPTGQAWSFDSDTALLAVLKVIAAELAFIHERAEGIIREALPSSTRLLLEDWENAAGLPDDCTVLADSVPERIAALVSKVLRIGGQSRQYFTEVAASLGYDIEIEENRPFMCGISHCGTDHLTGGHEERYVWQVIVKDAKLLYLYCGESTIDSPLLDFRQADDLNCVLQKLKPAHTHLIVGYEGV
jgi:uncharacterized protein YmfQ (DUF2313 family)